MLINCQQSYALLKLFLKRKNEKKSLLIILNFFGLVLFSIVLNVPIKCYGLLRVHSRARPCAISAYFLQMAHGKSDKAGFVLSIAIVAKCDKKINVAQDFFIWRKCMATTFCQVT